jgi:hypothetical protein
MLVLAWLAALFLAACDETPSPSGSGERHQQRQCDPQRGDIG